jgi:formylglycine-generating enzyme required for sulfatase activity
MDKVVTPTIIFFGTIDRQVPTEQGWQHFRALQHLGKTDTRFVLFPGEAHSPKKYWHQRRKVVEEIAWFDKYLFKPGEAIDESLKPGSPLAAALRLKAAGATPETVERGAIRIGRFEVTRAQFAAFRSGYEYPAGTGDYPANNVSFEDAKAYCDWLAGETGRKFRLGTEKELDKYLKASADENTLDAWAGYTVNLDDAGELAAKVRSLGPGALLKPAGSYEGDGEDPVFDLGGNVAEWVVAEDETGKPLGGSGDRPADAKSNGKPAPDYTGFRVVEEI